VDTRFNGGRSARSPMNCLGLLIILAAVRTICWSAAFISAPGSSKLSVANSLVGVLESAKTNGTSSPRRIGVVVFASAFAGGAGASQYLTAEAADLPEEKYFDLIKKYAPEHPPLRSESSAADLALAKHLKEIGAECFTAWWCPHCQDQREQFGLQAAAAGPFVQCSDMDRKQLPYCKEKDIPGYPVWIINGKMKQGMWKLAELANFSGFTEYPADAFSVREKAVTNYIWNRKL